MSQDTSTINSVAFVSLGCPKNLVDSEKMLGTLAQSGLELVSDHDEADAIVVNTCGFMEASKDESLEVIREAVQRKEAGGPRRVVVAGCLVQRHRAKLLEWAPGIDAMIGVFDRDHVLEAVRGSAPVRENAVEDPDAPRYWISGNALQAADDRGLATTGLTVHGKDGKGIGYFEDDAQRIRLTPRHWAYLRVSEGCNQKCAFCTIPSIRGKMRSKPLERILEEAKALANEGCFELNLIGQDTTSFGYDIGDQGGLVGMLESIDSILHGAGGGWARLMYAYPTFFDDAMIDAIGRLQHVVNYIDIPLQHITNLSLLRMNRPPRAHTEDLLYKLRDRIPNLALRTTFISGFPGETQEEHEDLMRFTREFKFERLGAFAYSEEDGTPAATYPDQVEQAVRDLRRDQLIAQQQQISEDFAQSRVGSEVDVIIDGFNPEFDAWTGRTSLEAPDIDPIVFVADPTGGQRALEMGQMRRCKIVGTSLFDLEAHLVD